MDKVIIGNTEKQVIWDAKKAEPYIDDIHFDGHRILWGFSYEPHTYLKESELSGEEWRKGGWIKFFRNKVQVYEEFCRTPENAILRLQHILWKLQEIDWDKLQGKKIYWRETPAIIDHVIFEQGAFIIKPDGVSRFPDHVWATEDWEKLEDPTSVKIDIFDPHIWWFRD